jgi:hypothetical protein
MIWYIYIYIYIYIYNFRQLWRECSLAGDPEGFVEKALETGISFHRGPVLGNLEEGSSTGEFKRWMKGLLG